jgi:arylsulfatase A-like enzyme
MTRTVAVLGACGALAGAIVGLCDAYAIAWGAKAMFFDGAEMARTMATAIGLCAGAGALLAALFGSAVELAGRRAEAVSAPRVPRRFVAALALPLFAVLCFALWRLTSGPKASGIPARGALVAIAAAVVALGSIAIAVLGVRFAWRSRPRRIAAALACLVAALALHAADARVLVRLYPIFHVGLTIAAVGILALGLRLLAPARPGRIAAAIGAALAVGALVGGGLALREVRGHMNPRFVIGEKTAAAADVLSAAQRVPGFLPRERGGPVADLRALGGAASGGGGRIARPGAPVVIVTVDALRYDRIGARASARRVAPHVDAFFKTAVVFDRAYTPIPHTSYAITSMLTGKYIYALKDVPGAPSTHETLPEVLRRFRYRSAGFFTKAVFFIDRSRFEPYLRTGYGFDFAKIEYETTAKERVAQTMAFLDEQRAHKRLALTWTHFFEPHEPYDPGCTRFGGAEVARYDCEISVVDEALADLFAYLDARYPDAIVVFAADHGEEFGDHGGRYHGTTLYDEQVRVPFAIRVPGVAPRTVREPVSLVDLFGTLLGLLDLPVPARVRSRDLGPLIAGGTAKDQPVFSEVHEQVMAERGDLKLIWDRAADTVRLYDLAADPGEAVSIAERRPEAVRELEALARAFRASHAPLELRPVETAPGSSAWPAAVQRALGGDAGAVPELLDLIAKSNPAPVRRKAAELIARLRRGAADPRLAIAAAAAADDPETSAWIAAARSSAGDGGAVGDLRAAVKALPGASQAFREAALALAAADPNDREAAAAVIAIAGSDEAPVEDRQRALGLVAANRIRSAERTAEAALGSYQLALDAARALAAIGSTRAVPGLVARLARERFPERRAAVLGALAAFRDRRAVTPIAMELAREEPASGALRALVDLGAVARGGKPIRLPATGEILCARTTPKPGDGILCRLGAVRRVVVATDARADGGALRVTCNNAAAGEIPVTSGAVEAYVDVAGCAPTDEGFISIRAVPEPADLQVEVRAIAAVGTR